MDPVTLGMMVAALVAKSALEKAGQQAGTAGWETLEQVAQRVRGWFGRRGDTAGERALAVVEAAPDSQRAVETLATAVTAVARQDPGEALAVQQLVDRAEADGGVGVATFVNQVRDQATVGRIIQVSGVYHERG